MSAGTGGGSRRVRVVRSGGIAGMRVEREVDLDQLDHDEADAWRRLLESPEVRRPQATERARPDGFGYRLVSEDDGLDVTVPEQQLPEDARSLLERAVKHR